MKKRILLCDDERHILRAVEFIFQRAGYEVQCATNGQEALEMIAAGQPDILVTDCQMPCLDGIGLVRALRSNEETLCLPVLLLTAKGFELTDQLASEQLGILEVISKPFSPQALLGKVNMVFADETVVRVSEAQSPVTLPDIKNKRDDLGLPTEIFGDVIVVHTPEEMSAGQADQLVHFLTDLERTKVVVDMDGTETIDSQGLAALLDAHDSLRSKDGDMRICTGNSVNRKILEVTRIDHQLEVFGSIIDAVKNFA